MSAPAHRHSSLPGCLCSDQKGLLVLWFWKIEKYSFSFCERGQSCHFSSQSLHLPDCTPLPPHCPALTQKLPAGISLAGSRKKVQARKSVSWVKLPKKKLFPTPLPNPLVGSISRVQDQTPLSWAARRAVLLLQQCCCSIHLPQHHPNPCPLPGSRARNALASLGQQS